MRQGGLNNKEKRRKSMKDNKDNYFKLKKREDLKSLKRKG